MGNLGLNSTMVRFRFMLLAALGAFAMSQFHYGSIQIAVVKNLQAVVSGLNSTMVRFRLSDR